MFSLKATEIWHVHFYIETSRLVLIYQSVEEQKAFEISYRSSPGFDVEVMDLCNVPFTSNFRGGNFDTSELTAFHLRVVTSWKAAAVVLHIVC